MNNICWGDSWNGAWVDNSWGQTIAPPVPVVVEGGLDGVSTGSGVNTTVIMTPRDWKKEERERIEARIREAQEEFKFKKPKQRKPRLIAPPMLPAYPVKKPVVEAPVIAANDDELEMFMMMLAEAA